MQKVYRALKESKPCPDSGHDWLICSCFARQLHGFLVLMRLTGVCWFAIPWPNPSFVPLSIELDIQMKQSRPDSGFDSQVKVPNTLQVVPLLARRRM